MESTLVSNQPIQGGGALDKKKLKIQKKKEAKKKQKERKRLQLNGNGSGHANLVFIRKEEDSVKKESEDDTFHFDESDPSYELYSKLLNHFDGKDRDGDVQMDTGDTQQDTEMKSEEQPDTDALEGEEDNEQGKNKPTKLSNKDRKKQQRINLPILKQLVERPDVVELHDVNSPFPTLLISLKAYRNTIAVPAHWCQKRKYLQGKRGYVKPPFELPSFIAATGISKIRDAILQREQKKTTKQKQRDRLQPKMRSMDINYEVMRDAFFVHQTKPKLTVIGDLYYEGKEFQVQTRNKKPGVLSDELKRALGMVDGQPPPWLTFMQMFGPPPSYPNLKIPGVNAPIPEGSQYGFYLGAWGRPSVDDSNGYQNNVINMDGEPIIKEHWGELTHEGYEEDQEEEEEEEEKEDQEGNQEDQEENQEQEEVTDGTSSVPSGLETPDVVEIKKRTMGMPGEPKQLYQELEQQDRAVAGNMMGSTHRYSIPSVIKGNHTAKPGAPGRVDIIKSQRTGPVEVTFDPSEIEQGITEDLIKKKHEQALNANTPVRPKEDYSDIIAEQSKKRKEQLEKSKQQKFKF